MTQITKLIPDGFCDLIFTEAENKFKSKNLVLEHFLQSGFRLIETSLVEFSDKSDLYDDAFVTFDVKTGKSLVFRNDITLQIDRLLRSRLKNHELPLKLCYSGEVLSNKDINFNGQRQQTQIGVEIIGSNNKNSDIEVINASLEAAKKLGNQDILIEVSLPDLLNKFLDEVQLSTEQREDLSKAILSKNISKIRDTFGEKLKPIEDIILRNDDLENNIRNFNDNYNSEIILAELDKARSLNELLKNNFECRICFDLFGDHKSLYHNSISFDIFANNSTTPIARGGRYKIGGIDAVGSTLYI